MLSTGDDNNVEQNHNHIKLSNTAFDKSKKIKRSRKC